MKLTYDLRYNIAYIQLQEKTAAVETLQVGRRYRSRWFNLWH